MVALAILLALVAVAALVAGPAPVRLAGGILAAAALVLALVVVRQIPPAPSVASSPGAAATSPAESPRSQRSAGAAALPDEAAEMWQRILSGELRFGSPELDRWASSHPGVATESVVAFAALRSGDYERAGRLAEAAAGRKGEPGFFHAARVAGEAAYARAHYDDAVRFLELAGEGDDDPAILQRLSAALREAKLERSYLSFATSHFEVKVPGGDEAIAADLGRLLDAAWEQAEARFGPGPPSRPVAYLYRAGDFSLAADLPAWVTGLYDGRVRIPAGELGADRRRLEETIRHEVTHVFVTHRSRNFAPAWVQEGLAQLAEREIERGGPPAAVAAPLPAPFPGWLRARAFDVSDRQKARSSYEGSLRQARLLLDEKGWEAFAQLLDRLSGGEAIEAAFLRVFGRELDG